MLWQKRILLLWKSFSSEIKKKISQPFFSFSFLGKRLRRSTDLHGALIMLSHVGILRHILRNTILWLKIYSQSYSLPLQVIRSQFTNGSRMEYHLEIRIIHSTKLTTPPGKMQEVINAQRRTMQVPYSAKRLMSLLSVSILDSIYPSTSIVCSIISLGYCFLSVMLAPF